MRGGLPPNESGPVAGGNARALAATAVTVVLFLVAAGALAAYVILKDQTGEPVAQQPPEPAPPDTGLRDTKPSGGRPPEVVSPDTGPASNPRAGERPADTGRAPEPKGPPPAPALAWQDISFENAGFSASFPGKPDTVRKNIGGATTQTVSATLKSPPASFTVICVELDKLAAAEPGQVLAGVAAGFGEALRSKHDVKLGPHAGLELVVEESQDGSPWTTVQRLFVVKGRLYQLIATAPRDRHDPALAARFLDSFALLESPEPPEPLKPPVPVKPAPRQGGLAALKVELPDGWAGDFNKFKNRWTFKKVTASSSGAAQENTLEIGELSEEAKSADAYAERVRARDFLEIDSDFTGYAFVEVAEKQTLPDGFVILGSARNWNRRGEKPQLGLVVVREVGGVKLRCVSPNLRDEALRREALEVCRSARFAEHK